MKLVADANVLLAAVLGGRARLILEHASVETVFAAADTLAEVQQYAGILAKKKRLRLDVVLLAVATLPVTVVEAAAYQEQLVEAARRIGKRDPDDVPVLALALSLQVPVWSNDKDFTGVGVEWFTTESLLKLFGSRG